MDDFKGKEFVTLPLSGKCSHKPRFGFPSNVTPGSPALGTCLVSACVGKHLLIGWLHLSSPSQYILIGEFLISSLLQAVNMLLFVQPLRSYGLVG